MSSPSFDSKILASPGRLWLADSIRSLVLKRVMDSAAESRKAGLRPRLVIFDYLESPVGGALRAMASDLGMLVSVEAVERTLPSAALRDRFRLLEKSQGIHGVFFPSGMTPTHRACLEHHPELKGLDLDAPQEGLSPVTTSFLQLAASKGWNPEGKRCIILLSEETFHLSDSLRKELTRAGMLVNRFVLEHGDEAQHLSRCDCLWLCHGLPVQLRKLHLPSNAVVVDCGRAFDLPASLSVEQNRYLAGTLRGLCPADGGLATLTYLHRLSRLIRRAQKASRSGPGAWSRSRTAPITKGVRV